MASASDRQALEYIDQAVKALNAFRLFNRDAKYEEAAELYGKAAAQYKIAKMWDEAGNAYAKAAEMCVQGKNEHEATTNYTNAAKMYKQAGNKRDANKMYEVATRRLQESNKFAPAAKLYKELAEVEEADNHAGDAIEAYQKAAECYQAEDAATSANQMLIKVADLSAMQEDYKRAIQIYEQVSKASLDNNLTRWSVTDYLFKSALCAMALGAKTNDDNGMIINDKLDQYKDMHAQFEQSREYGFLKNCAAAISESDVDKFVDAVADYDALFKLDKYKVNILNKVRQALENPSNSGPNLA